METPRNDFNEFSSSKETDGDGVQEFLIFNSKGKSENCGGKKILKTRFRMWNGGDVTTAICLQSLLFK